METLEGETAASEVVAVKEGFTSYSASEGAPTSMYDASYS